MDIEKIKNISPRIIERLLDGCSQDEAVLRWTERESYGKFTGEGLIKADFRKEHCFAVYDDIDGYVVTICAADDCFPDRILFPEIAEEK